MSAQQRNSATPSPDGDYRPKGRAFFWIDQEAVERIRENLERDEAASAQLVYSALCELACKRRSRSFDITRSKIASLASVSSTTCWRRTLDLQRLGLITITERIKTGSNERDTNLYEVISLRNEVISQPSDETVTGSTTTSCNGEVISPCNDHHPKRVNGSHTTTSAKEVISPCNEVISRTDPIREMGDQYRKVEGEEKERTASSANGGSFHHEPTPNGHTQLCFAEHPSREEVLFWAQKAGLAEWKANDWFDEMEGCGWLDHNKRPVVKWQSVIARVKTKWEVDGRPDGPPKSKGYESTNGNGSFWQDQKRLELVESELKAIRNRASQTATGIILEEKDKPAYARLKAERDLLKAKILSPSR